MTTLRFVRRAVRLLLLALGCVAAFSACATREPAPSRATAYRLVWIVTRTADHYALVSPTMVLNVGTKATIRTVSSPPTEDQPAFTRFSARLDTTKAAGVLQLVTRADLREAARNKKGKLKVSKRNIGALVPIRPGETQLVSLPTDPVHLEVRLERE